MSESPTPQDEELILVLGMHRSGTSLLAEALHASGYAISEKLLPADADINARGYWEDAEVVDLNERLFDALQCHWYSLTPLTPGWERDKKLAAFRKQAADLLTQRYQGERSVLKDPRMTRLLPLWNLAFKDCGLSPRIILVMRPPGAIAASLEKRNGLSRDYGLLLWARYMLDLMPALDSWRWTTLDYEQLLADGSDCITTALRAVDSGEILDPAAMAQVVDPGLCHHRGTQSEPDSPLLEQIRILYRALSAESTSLPEEFPILGDEQLTSILSTLAAAVVDRYSRQVQIGHEHTKALDTVASRDKQLADTRSELDRLGKLHAEAQSLVGQRDEQLQDVNARLQATGKELEHAQAVVRERDQQLAELQQQLAQVNARAAEYKEAVQGNVLARLALKLAGSLKKLEDKE